MPVEFADISQHLSCNN